MDNLMEYKGYPERPGSSRKNRMKIQEMKAEYRIQEMQKMIRARTESGLTVSEWCQENNFSEGSYYYWLKKIREKTIEEVKIGNFKFIC